MPHWPFTFVPSEFLLLVCVLERADEVIASILVWMTQLAVLLRVMLTA